MVVFHSLLLKYYPRRLKVSFYEMIARTQLAVLLVSQAMKAGHAVSKNNTSRYKLQYSKVSKAIVNVTEQKYR